MALNAHKYRDALVGLGPETPVFMEPPSSFREWLTQKNIPEDVVEFLLATAVANHIPLADGCGGIWTPRDIMELNDQESAILAGGLLGVGSSDTGDFIVIDVRDDERQAGFVSHYSLWECATTWTDIREIFEPVADSLDEMLRPDSPADYSDAILRKKKAIANLPTRTGIKCFARIGGVTYMLLIPLMASMCVFAKNIETELDTFLCIEAFTALFAIGWLPRRWGRHA